MLLEVIDSKTEFNCKACGNTFRSNKACKSRIPKYCSKECFGKSLIGKKQKARPKMSDDQKKNISLLKRGSIPWNKKELISTECATCKKSITHRTGALYNPKFCSMECRNESYKGRNFRTKKGETPFKDSIQICDHCSSEFKNKKPKKFCSVNCYSESMRVYKNCLHCGNTIDTKGGAVNRRKYCSYKCATDSNKGKSFSEEHKNAISVARKNSEKCRGKNIYNWKGGQETLNLRSKINQHRRKSRTKMKADKLFLFSVFQAQKKKCFYCEESLAEYKAIEHMTPICRGGDNQDYNLVYSCKSCNSRKREKTMEEYAVLTKNFHWIDKWDYVFSTALTIKEQVKCYLTSKQRS